MVSTSIRRGAREGERSDPEAARGTHVEGEDGSARARRLGRVGRIRSAWPLPKSTASSLDPPRSHHGRPRAPSDRREATFSETPLEPFGAPLSGTVPGGYRRASGAHRALG